MLICALDTSAETAAAAIVRDGKMLASAQYNSGLTHSETALALVDQVLTGAGVKKAEVDLFAVSIGPGSFTGVRIGVAAIKGLAYALNKPVAGVSSLEALAWNVPAGDWIACPALDARKGRVYCALFAYQNGEPVRLTEDAVMTAEETRNLLRNDEKTKILLGDGAELCYNDMERTCLIAPESAKWPNGCGVAAAGERMYREGRAGTSFDLLPQYLCVPQAERERNARLAAEHSES